MNWTITVYDDWDAIWCEEHLAKWMTLMDSSSEANMFFHPSMVKAWVETYLPIRNLSPIFMWVKADDGNEAFFPLVKWRKNWRHFFVSTIIPVGYSDYDYHDPVFKHLPDSESINIFWDSVYHCLESYQTDIIEITGIHPNLLPESAKVWVQEEACPYLALDGINNESELMQFFKSSLRGDIRRQIRRLSEFGELHIKEYKTWSEIEPTFGEFMQKHTLRWPNAYKAPLFHKRLLSDKMLETTTHFSSLNIGEKPIAWHLGFSYKGIYYYYMPAGDNNYSTYSPVKVHLYFLMERAVRLGYVKYDHLRGEENYKAGWSSACDHLYRKYDRRTAVGSWIRCSFDRLLQKIMREMDSIYVNYKNVARRIIRRGGVILEFQLVNVDYRPCGFIPSLSSVELVNV